MRNFLLILSLISIFYQLSPCTLVAAQPWHEAYDAALNDIRSKNWSLAEERLKSAFSQQPKQGKTVRAYGARFMRYLPEYYIGIVYYNTGRYQQALEVFLRVQNKNLIVQGDEEYNELNRLTQEAMAKMNSKQTPVTSTADEQFAQLMDQASKSFAAKNFQEAEMYANRALAKGVDDEQAKRLLKKIDTAQVVQSMRMALDKNDLSEAERIASKLEALDPQSPELDRLRQMRSKQIVEQKPVTNPMLAESIEELRSAIEKKQWAQAQQISKKIEVLDPQHPDLLRFKQMYGAIKEESAPPQFDLLITQSESALRRGDLTRARILMQEAQNVPGADSVKIRALTKNITMAENIRAMRKELQNKNWNEVEKIASRIRAIDPNHPELKKIPVSAEEDIAILSFYSGDYDQASKLLESLISRGVNSSKIYFYLGCTNASQGFLKGKAGQDLLQKARTYFARVRQDPEFRFETTFISPKIQTLYRQSS